MSAMNTPEKLLLLFFLRVKNMGVVNTRPRFSTGKYSAQNFLFRQHIYILLYFPVSFAPVGVGSIYFDYYY